MSKNYRHHYWLMRHGESWANFHKLIITSIATDQAGEHGLTDKGKMQARDSATDNIDKILESGKPVIVLHSPLRRAIQTAGVLTEVLQEHGAEVSLSQHDELIERHFGDLDGASSDEYHAIWQQDAEDGSHTDQNVESIDAVLARMQGVVDEMEASDAPDSVVVFVGHGDPLNALWADHNGVHHTKHSHDQMINAELRRIS